jgi:phosphoglycolate phosphatase-like HAD superfamily hydrolase
MLTTPIAALIWDYDGTLIDSLAKNLAVTKVIFKELFNTGEAEHPALRTQTLYNQALQRCNNWQHLYREEFKLSPQQVEIAGAAWGEVQQRVVQATPVYQGLSHLFDTLVDIPNGIVSQNAKNTIEDTLVKNRLAHHFDNIIGYQDVSLLQQKPHPQGLLISMSCLCKDREGTVLFIGDHHTDVEMAHRARQVMDERGAAINVTSVLVRFGDIKVPYHHQLQPDFIIDSPSDLLSLIRQQ